MSSRDGADVHSSASSHIYKDNGDVGRGLESRLKWHLMVSLVSSLDQNNEQSQFHVMPGFNRIHSASFSKHKVSLTDIAERASRIGQCA